jgi:hypothetical protein
MYEVSTYALATYNKLDELSETWGLDAAASYLSWDDETWVKYADEGHPYTNPHGGYYALNIAHIVADS